MPLQVSTFRRELSGLLPCLDERLDVLRDAVLSPLLLVHSTSEVGSHRRYSDDVVPIRVRGSIFLVLGHSGTASLVKVSIVDNDDNDKHHNDHHNEDDNDGLNDGDHVHHDHSHDNDECHNHEHHSTYNSHVHGDDDHHHSSHVS
eukprot:s5116_g3.t1